jgi:6-phosphofructokinase 1
VSVSDIINRGGTILRTARLPEFKAGSDPAKRLSQLKKFGIEAVVVIGGDGSYMGAKKLTEMGINCVGLPGTIDNDIASTDYTIGFDTCLNTIVECVDKIRDTTESHSRCSIIEVMGNHCGDLALFSGLAEGVEMILTPDHPIPEEEIMKTLKAMHDSEAKRAIVIVSEKLYPDITLSPKRVQANRLRYPRRCLRPRSAGWRSLGVRPDLGRPDGRLCGRLPLEGKGGICIGMVDNKIVDYDIYEALALPRDKHVSMLRLIDILA